MKIAVTSAEPNIEAKVDPRFGRCSYFVISDLETGNLTTIDNTNAANAGGAGVSTAQIIIDEDINVVITGNCGPNAYKALSNAGIQIITGASGTISDVIEQYKNGGFKEASEPNVKDHHGMNL